MFLQRTIAVITLAAFLPMAAGCSKTEIRRISTNPVEPSGPVEPVEIVAYTDHDGARHEWAGTIEPAGADSLLFVRPDLGEQWWGGSSSRRKPDIRLKLSRMDVESVEVKSKDALSSIFSVWVVSIGAAAWIDFAPAPLLTATVTLTSLYLVLAGILQQIFPERTGSGP